MYNSFTIFTGMRYLSLWLSSHSSSKLCGFFWWTYLFSSVFICSMIFKSGLWASQCLNMVTPSSDKLCSVVCALRHGALSYWKISPSSKSGIKLSFSNWMYLELFKFQLVLTNFFEPSLFMYSQSIRLLPSNFTVCHVTWVISLSWRLSDTFSLIRLQFNT